MAVDNIVRDGRSEILCQMQLVEMLLIQVRGSNYQLPTLGCMLRAPGVQKGGNRVTNSLENGQADGVRPIPVFLKRTTDAKFRDRKTHQTGRGRLRLHSREANP